MIKDNISRIIQEFRDRYFMFFPTKATLLGAHDYDDTIGRWDREGVREKMTFLEHYRDLVKDSMEIDALVLKNVIDSTLFHLKFVKPYCRPDFFVNHALESIDYLIHLLEKAEDEAIQKDIVNSLVSRVSGFPILFENSKEWLSYTTPISRNLALYLVAYFQEFLETDYRKFIYSLELSREFKEKLIGVIPFTIESLLRFGHFVRSLEVVPLNYQKLRRAKNFFRDLFIKKYLLDHNIDSLLKIIEKKIASLTEDMKDISGRDVEGYFEGLVERNLVPYSTLGVNAYLMDYFQKKSEEYFEFCSDTNLIPTGQQPTIEWTPIYKRSTSPLASYISCGPYETVKKEGILWICPAREPLSKEEFHQTRYIYHHQMMNSMIIHELLGHHLQSDRVPKLENEVFKFSTNLSFDEGFALYVEDIFAREYAKTLKDGEEADEMIFFQKKAELMRAHRVYVDINLGTNRISIEEAIRYFSEKNSLPYETAKVECEKYYLNPGVASSYLIGKIELMNLSGHLEKKFKDKFSLSLFHHGLINYGSIPIPLIRRSMIEKLFVAENVIQ
ncbi:MAG: DUF885 family protein [Thermodesulfobacteriota bacterium]|nr:DUF885 family protein [Thermodesulfobacteriota bacterium]